MEPICYQSGNRVLKIGNRQSIWIFLQILSVGADPYANHATNSAAIVDGDRDLILPGPIVTESQADVESFNLGQISISPLPKFADTITPTTAESSQEKKNSTPHLHQPASTQEDLRKKDVMMQIIAELNTFRTDSVLQIAERIARSPDLPRSSIESWIEMSLLAEQAITSKWRSVIDHACRIESSGNLALAMIGQEFASVKVVFINCSLQTVYYCVAS